MSEPPPIWRRFAALAELGRPRRRIPVVQQLSASDCGAACLAMVLGYFGRRVSLDEARRLTGTGRSGAGARAILDAARDQGLRARGLRVERIEDLRLLPPATILHWEFRHFVVLERVTRDGAAVIVDPSDGRQTIGAAELGRRFTGVALAFESSAALTPRGGGQRRWRRYLGALRLERVALREIIVVSLVIQLLGLAFPLLTGLVVDRVVPLRDVSLLGKVVLGVALLAALQLVAALVRSHATLYLRTRLDAHLSLDSFEHLVRLPFAYFQERPTGDLLMRLGSSARVRDVMTSTVLSVALDGGLMALYLLVVLVVQPAMGALVVGLAGLRLAVAWCSLRLQRELLSSELQAESRSRSRQLELVDGIETLKSNGVEEQAVSGWSHLLVETLNAKLARERVAAKLDAVLETLRLLSPLAVLTYGALQVIDGRLSLGTMLALNALALGFFVPLAQLLGQAGELQLLGGHLDRLDEIFELPPEQEPGRPRLEGRLTGQLTLERVSFSYGPRAPVAIRDVKVDIEPGSFVAIVGRSGCGKSTLARLLVGLYSPSDGNVLLDGRNLQHLDLRSVRRQLGIVTQAPALFAGSIRSNIALVEPTASLARVMAAARLAELHDEVLAMPMGYDTPIDAQGSGISGGQRQRLAIARALLASPAVLVLDEATSALDTLTESAIQRRLEALTMTRIVIAHRLSTVRYADRILVMDAGGIVEDGPHDDLVARGGVYGALIAGQMERATA